MIPSPTRTATTVPSTAKQKVLGAALAEELTQMGLHNAHMDEYGYVYAWLPATAGCEGMPCVGLIAHMDTSPRRAGRQREAPHRPLRGGRPGAQRGEGHRHEGRRSLRAWPSYVGQELIVTDGTTLLGADDKAGVAEIMSAVEYLVPHPEIPHGRIAVGFTPDEEVGRAPTTSTWRASARRWPTLWTAASWASWSMRTSTPPTRACTVHGVNIHPGSAKNKMKNALLIALEFAGHAARRRRPPPTPRGMRASTTSTT